MEDDILKKQCGELNDTVHPPYREETDTADTNAVNATGDITADKNFNAAESTRAAHKKPGGKTIALIACTTVAVLFGVFAIFTNSGLWLALTLLFAAAIIVLVVFIAQEKYKRRNPTRTLLPFWGIVTEVVCVPLFILGMSIISYFLAAAMLIVLAALACPIFGLAAGITTVVRGKKNVGTANFALGIADIIIPVLGLVIILIVILLISTGVIIISLM